MIVSLPDFPDFNFFFSDIMGLVNLTATDTGRTTILHCRTKQRIPKTDYLVFLTSRNLIGIRRGWKRGVVSSESTRSGVTQLIFKMSSEHQSVESA